MKNDWTPEERAAIEAKYRAEFTAADLQKYTEEDDVVPLAEIIRELGEKQRRLDEEKKRLWRRNPQRAETRHALEMRGLNESAKRCKVKSKSTSVGAIP